MPAIRRARSCSGGAMNIRPLDLEEHQKLGDFFESESNSSGAREFEALLR
jgi:hypothetical protein